MLSFLRQRLQYKLTFAFLLVLVIPIGITTTYNLSQSQQALTEVVRLNQNQLLNAKIADVEAQLAEAVEDIVAISQSSEVRNYIEQVSQGDASFRLGIVNNFLTNYLTRFGDDDASICILNNLGVEVTCIDRENGVVSTRDITQLQDRFDADYFTNAISQTGHIPGQVTPVSISDLSLNDQEIPM
ncbi:MAG: hypothetical protein AAFQ07_17420, partial [Chloroflexota bacterium]